ncbi:MAG: sensor histidine kinase [Bacteroides sp.]
MLLPRLILLLLTSLSCGALWAVWLLHAASSSGKPWALILATGTSLLLPIMVVWHVRAYHRHTRKLLFLLEAIENNDTSIRFSEPDRPDKEPEHSVNAALNRLATMLHHIKQQTAQQEKYYELILECAGSGILVINHRGDVCQKNSEALRLLSMEVLTHIYQLSRLSPSLSQQLHNCHGGDTLHASYSNRQGEVTLSIHVRQILLGEEELRIIALNDIRNELDQQELDAWVRLTRVLIHEIMNAITPITSISDTLLQLSYNTPTKVSAAGQPLPTGPLPEEVTQGLQTISSTGQSLMHFVESYRRFTSLPTPSPEVFGVKEFLQRMVHLSRHQYAAEGIRFHVEVQPDDLLLYADEKLISQVMTNLLKNAIQAIEEGKTAEGEIRLRAYSTASEAVVIEVSNNGPQIPAETAAHIFIPFFSTKPQGSGIGLSISRQIMRLSGGHLRLLPGIPTTFQLTFD